MSLPTKVLRTTFSHRGRGEQVDIEVPDTGEPDEILLEEVRHYVQTLEDNQQIAYDDEPAPPRATHVIESRPDGTRRLVRRVFTSN